MHTGNVCGERIRQLRAVKRMLQTELSAAMHVDFDIQTGQNTISEIENGRRFVRDRELIAIAEILDVNPLWLLYGDDIPEKFKKWFFTTLVILQKFLFWTCLKCHAKKIISRLIPLWNEPMRFKIGLPTQLMCGFDDIMKNAVGQVVN